MMLSRRGLIAGLGALLAAPAIVRASSLMPVKAFASPYMPYMGLAQLKQEGAPVPFDYTAGEQIYAGDMVRIGDDGRVYRVFSGSQDWQGSAYVAPDTAREGATVHLAATAPLRLWSVF